MHWRRSYTFALYAALAIASLLVFWPLSDDSKQYRQGVEAADRGDFQRTFTLWQPLAEKGYPRAQYGLGVLYERGQGTQRNLHLAVKWYTKAAEQQIWEAQVNLGLILIGGEGVPRDYQAAAAWFGKAADQGSPDAKVNLGNLYRQGQGVPKDPAKATTLFRQAAQQDHPLGQFLLAEQLAAATPPDPGDAYFWARLAARHDAVPGHPAGALADHLATQLSATERAALDRRVAQWRPGALPSAPER